MSPPSCALPIGESDPVVLPDASVWVEFSRSGSAGREMLSSLSWAELTAESWRDVGSVAALLRREGRTLPLTDLVIAVAAAQGGHGLWSFDADFERIGTVLADLVLYQPPTGGAQ